MTALKPGDTVLANTSLGLFDIERNGTFVMVPLDESRSRIPLYRTGDFLGEVIAVEGDMIRVQLGHAYPLKMFLSSGIVCKEDQWNNTH